MNDTMNDNIERATILAYLLAYTSDNERVLGLKCEACTSKRMYLSFLPHIFRIEVRKHTCTGAPVFK